MLLMILPVAMEQARRSVLNSTAIRGVSWRSVQLISDLMPLLGVGIPAAIFPLGMLTLTAREQYGPADRTDRRRRVLLRALATVPLLGIVGEGALLGRVLSQNMRYTTMEWSSFALSAAVLAACIPLPGLLFYQLRSLAKRARSAHLAEHCAIVGVGMSSGVSYATVMLIIFQFAKDWGLDPDWGTRSSVSLVLMLVCTLSAALFTIWSLYLLIRFAIAFHFAARQLRQKWRADDRANAGVC